MDTKAASPPSPTLPGAPPLPLLGARLDLLRFFADPVHHLLAMAARGPIGALTADNRSLVFAFGAAHNQAVLANPALFRNAVEVPVRLPEGSAATRIFGGVKAMNGEEHRRHRRLLLPVVSKAAVARYVPDIVELTARHLARWEREEVIDLGPACDALTSAVLMRCLFDSEGTVEGAAMAAAGARLLQLFTSPLLILLPLRIPGLPYARFLDTCEEVEQRMRGMIAAREGSEAAGRDVLSILLRGRDEDDGTRLSEEQVMAHLASMILAGHDPIASSLTFSLLMLAQHPAVARELADELDGALGGQAPTHEDLGRLPLLDGVVHETMRLLPPIVHLLFRRPDAPVQLGDHALPAGATVILSPLISHRDPTAFPEPLRFRPHRWVGARFDPYAFIPFGAGPRTCIGAGLAGAIVRIQLAMILQRRRPEMVGPLALDLRVRAANLLTLGPLPLRLPPRSAPNRAPAPLGGVIRRLVELP